MNTLIAILGVILVSALYGIILYYVFKYGAQGVLEWYWNQVRLLVDRIMHGHKPKHKATPEIDSEVMRILWERKLALQEHDALPERSIEEWGHPAGCEVCYPPPVLDVNRVIKSAGVRAREAFCSHSETYRQYTLGGDIDITICTNCGKVMEDAAHAGY